jgi:hypothetical protein
MKIAAAVMLWAVSALVMIAMIGLIANKLANELPGAIGSAVAQAQVSYQKAHDAAVANGAK